MTRPGTEAEPRCRHGVARLVAVRKEGPNQGRFFYSCANPQADKCNFFKWADGAPPGTAAPGLPIRGRARVASLPDLERLARARGIALHCGAVLLRRPDYRPGAQGRGRGARGRYAGQRREEDEDGPSRRGPDKLALQLPRRQESSKYTKGTCAGCGEVTSLRLHDTTVAMEMSYTPSHFSRHQSHLMRTNRHDCR